MSKYIPRANNGGAPFAIKLLAPIIGGPFSWDVLIFLPLLGLGIALILSGFFITVIERQGDLIFYSIGGLVIFSGCVAAILFGRNVPRIPDEDDAPRIDISDPNNYPTAPVPPLRSQLTAVGSTWFKDTKGRRVLLRGINVSGDCKLPMPRKRVSVNGGSEEMPPAIPDHPSAPNPSLPPNHDKFYDYQNVTFVGRPFPLDQADIHISRLRAWGYTTFRLLFTWEAVEHEGPGIYDEEYLQYLVAVIRKCHQHGISVFLDSHQDVWSRFTGGDGAPAWTLEKVGFDLTKLGESGAAYLTRPEDAVTMAWNANNMRCAAG